MRGESSIELHASNKSQIAGQALSYISALYDVEREVKSLTADERLRIRQAKSRPLADALYQWMVLQRGHITVSAQRTHVDVINMCCSDQVRYAEAASDEAGVRRSDGFCAWADAAAHL